MKRPLFCLFCLMCLGICLWYPRTWPEDPVFPQGDSYSVEVTGTVASYEEKENSFSILLSDCRISYETQLYQCDRLLISAKTDPHVRPGNEVRASGSLSSFQPARNPGNMDWQLYYRSRHISYRLYAQDLVVTDPHVSRLNDMLLTLRDYWMAQLSRMERYWQDRSIPLCASTDVRSVLTALLLGNQSFLPEETYSLYETAGILPLLSISGLHITLIGGKILWLGRKLRLPPWLGRLSASLLLILYWQLCGGKVSAGRAVILFVCMNIAPLVHRSYDPLSALSLAGILFLLESPLLLFQSSFLLSFGAVFGIYLIGPVLSSPASGPLSDPPAQGLFSPAIRYLKRAFSFGITLQLTLFPLTIYLFFRYPLYTTLANLLILPLTTPLLLSGFLGLLLSSCSLPAGSWLLLPCRCILWFYETLCRCIAALPGASLLPGCPAPIRIALYYILLSALVLTVKKQRRIRADAQSHAQRLPARKAHARGAYAQGAYAQGSHTQEAHVQGAHTHVLHPLCLRASLRLRLLTLLLALSLLPALLLPLPGRGLQVTFVDVGQGDCALIRSPSGTTVLIDGGSSDLSRVTEDRFLPFLESQGIDELDYVFLSHTDEDHVNAVVDWLEAGHAIGAVILPRLNERLSAQDSYLAVQEAALRHHIPLLFFSTGDLWQEGDLSLLCLGPQPADSPAGGSYISLNAASLVLLMEYQGVRILFTGDCGEEGESLLVSELEERQLSCHVLKAGHHGSRTSTGEALLSQLQPSLCVISCGVHNSYHHPSPETLSRLEAAGVPCYVTADCGAILLRIQRGKIRLRTMLTR